MPESLDVVETLLNNNDLKGARLALTRFLRTDIPTDEYNQVMLYRARLHLLEARPDRALDDLMVVKANSPDLLELPDNLELLADSYLARFELATVGFANRQDVIIAQDIYANLLRNHADSVDTAKIHHQLGTCLLITGQFGKASEHFRQALAAMPDHQSKLAAHCYERLAFSSFFNEREPEKALEYLDLALKAYPSDGDKLWLVQVYTLRSRILWDLKRPGLALDAIRTAITIASAHDNPDTRNGLSEALLTAGELFSQMPGYERQVIQYLNQFTQLNKKPAGIDVTWSRVYEMLANAHFTLGRFDEAIAHYKSVVQTNPYHPWATTINYRIACSYYRLGHYRDALQAVNAVLSTSEAEDGLATDYRLFDLAGNAYFALGDYTNASNAYQKALKLAPPGARSLDKIKLYHQFSKQLSS